jgi:hypothetical protein
MVAVVIRSVFLGGTLLVFLITYHSRERITAIAVLLPFLAVTVAGYAAPQIAGVTTMGYVLVCTSLACTVNAVEQVDPP